MRLRAVEELREMVGVVGDRHGILRMSISGGVYGR